MASYKPTKKWVAALVTGAAAVVTHLIASGEFDSLEKGGVLALVVSLAGAWAKSNDPTPGGVPPKTEV